MLFISVVGSFGMMSIMVLCGLVVSTFLATSTFSESAFIAACFSLSSTPLVVKFTASPNNNTTTKTGRYGVSSNCCYNIILSNTVSEK